MNEIAVIPNNPRKNNARNMLEKTGKYENWGGGLNCIKEVGQLVIFYISGDIQRYQYLAKVTNIDTVNKVFDVKLISIFPETISEQFRREKLLELGLKPNGVIRYCLSSYPKILEFVSDTLLKAQIISEPFSIKKDINTNEDKSKTKEVIVPNEVKKTLNQILFGPPGTGKTYNTINKALEIIDGEVPSERIKAKERYEELKSAGRIEFVTFHQSYGYEEFVEGIKANTNDDGTLSYDVESGIFKKLSKKSLEEFSKSNMLSHVNKKRFVLNAKSLNIQAELIQDDENNFRVLNGSKIRKGEAESFKNYNYSDLKNTVLKKAKLKEESEFYILEEDYTFQSLSAASSVILGRMSNGLIDWKEIFDENNLFTANDERQIKNYILIIDEINRGNISKIFGELITLIEPSKRIGADEEIRVRLPYSGDNFGVPSNLYIIGTMNTADRSIALMDTALRRRFEFVEMLPDLETLDGLEVENINIKSMLEKINKRVEYLYDRDHTIGHAYFIDIKTKDDLDSAMRNKIIPLLQEYFYDDWEKILMVLGDGFIEYERIQDDIFDNEFRQTEYIENDKFRYTIKNEFDYSKFKGA